MKLAKINSCIWGCVLGFAISFGAIACIVTGFDMAVDLGTVALWCAVASAACGICYTLPLGLLPVSALALISGVLWQQGSLQTSAESLLYRLSRQYDRAYDWGILKLNLLTADDMELRLGLVLCLFGVLIAMAVTRAVCRGKSAVPGILLALLPLAACFVVTDTVPRVEWLYLLLLGLGVLLLSNTVRRQDGAQGNRLCAAVTLPVALALLVLLAAVPQNGYRGQACAKALADAVLQMELVEDLFGDVGQTGTSGSSVDSSVVNLKSVGVRLESQAEILQVLSDYDGVLYLRGRALDSYDGQTWSDSGVSSVELYWPRGSDSGGEVMITTRYAHRMLYLPYYVQSMNLAGLGRGIENNKKLTQYSFSCNPVPERAGDVPFQPYPEAVSQNLHLSDAVRQWAEPLAREITEGADTPYAKAQHIADYVRNSAVYDTNTRRMPLGDDDFVRWFLEESDTGYCVHFASAATVLLQAAGIPARYVTGYTVEVTAAHVAVVQAKDAHAWAEYWIPGYGWTVLEATPAAGDTDVTQPQQSTVPETTDREVPDTRPASGQTPETVTPKKPGSLTALWVALVGLVLVGIAAIQRRVRLRLRQKRRSQGTANAQAIAYWQEAVCLARLLGEPSDPALFDLAQRAKFSQHTTQEQELKQFESYIRAAQTRLDKRSVFHRFYYRVILARY